MKPLNIPSPPWPREPEVPQQESRARHAAYARRERARLRRLRAVRPQLEALYEELLAFARSKRCKQLLKANQGEVVCLLCEEGWVSIVGGHKQCPEPLLVYRLDSHRWGGALSYSVWPGFRDLREEEQLALAEGYRKGLLWKTIETENES